MFVIVVGLGLAVMLMANHSRLPRDAVRALARHEASYDLPRLGDLRDRVLVRLAKTLSGTLVGTQVSLLVAAGLAWLIPDDVAAPLVLMAVVWAGGQIGRLLGGIRETTPGAHVALRSVVPVWLIACWVVAALGLVWFVAFCLAQGAPALVTLGLVTAGLALAVAAVAVVGVRKALSSSTFMAEPVSGQLTEMFRGEAVRAGTVLWPGFVGALLLLVSTMAIPMLPQRTDGDIATLLAHSALGLVLWVATLVAGMLAVRWHARRVAPEPATRS